MPLFTPTHLVSGGVTPQKAVHEISVERSVAVTIIAKARSDRIHRDLSPASSGPRGEPHQCACDGTWAGDGLADGTV
jgi:hypothetical protein